MTSLFPEMAGDMRGDAIFSVDGVIRREVRRWWVPQPTRWVSWLMLNPSHANAERLDLTTNRVTAFSRAWGFDGWIGINVVPFISSTRPAMWRWFDWERNGPDWQARDYLHANLRDIERVGRMATLRMIAYGAGPAKRCPGWLEKCLEAYRQPSDVGADERLYCLGVTKDNEPKHPMARGKWRVPDDAKPRPW